MIIRLANAVSTSSAAWVMISIFNNNVRQADTLAGI